MTGTEKDIAFSQLTVKGLKKQVVLKPEYPWRGRKKVSKRLRYIMVLIGVVLVLMVVIRGGVVVEIGRGT
jgi:hypothetical protein